MHVRLVVCLFGVELVFGEDNAGRLWRTIAILLSIYGRELFFNIFFKVRLQTIKWL